MILFNSSSAYISPGSSTTNSAMKGFSRLTSISSLIVAALPASDPIISTTRSNSVPLHPIFIPLYPIFTPSRSTAKVQAIYKFFEFAEFRMGMNFHPCIHHYPCPCLLKHPFCRTSFHDEGRLPHASPIHNPPLHPSSNFKNPNR